MALTIEPPTTARIDPSAASVLRANALPLTLSGVLPAQESASALVASEPPQQVLVFGPTPTAVVLTVTTHTGASMAPTPEALPAFRYYVIQQGDTASSVASRFGLKTQSIVWSNPEVGTGDSLAIGQRLIIPAADGILHEVRYGETLNDIAARYGVQPEAILSFAGNKVSSADDISEAEMLFVPGGEPPAAAPAPQPTVTSTPVPATATPVPDVSVTTSTNDVAQPTPVPVASGNASSEGLIWPAVGPISSYYGPGHPLGIDIDLYANPNSPVVAATSGTVIFAGGNPCCSYGYYVEVLSPSGIETLYGHFSSIAVTVGQTVSQGEILGYAGCTGYCTGPHLHFEVIDNGVRENPLDYLP